MRRSTLVLALALVTVLVVAASPVHADGPTTAASGDDGSGESGIASSTESDSGPDGSDDETSAARDDSVLCVDGVSSPIPQLDLDYEPVKVSLGSEDAGGSLEVYHADDGSVCADPDLRGDDRTKPDRADGPLVDLGDAGDLPASSTRRSPSVDARPDRPSGSGAQVASEGPASVPSDDILSRAPTEALLATGMTAGSLAAFVLYRRLSEDDLLEHDIRERIVRAVRDAPGIERPRLAERLDVHPSTLAYHVRILEEAGVLDSVVEDGTMLLFCPDEHDRHIKTVKSALRHDARRRIVDVLLSEPGLNLSEAADRADVSVRMAHYHVDQLVDRGVLEALRDGRSKRLRVVDDIRRVLDDGVDV